MSPAPHEEKFQRDHVSGVLLTSDTKGGRGGEVCDVGRGKLSMIHPDPDGSPEKWAAMLRLRMHSELQHGPFFHSLLPGGLEISL